MMENKVQIDDFEFEINKIAHEIQQMIPSNSMELQYVINDYRNMCLLFKDIENLFRKQQGLIELHFAGVPFPLKLHELYHEYRDSLSKDIQIYFMDSKKMLNDFARFLSIVIPQKERRGISMRSFGSMVHNCNKVDETWKYYRLFSYIHDEGTKIDKEDLEYRDKFIEHSAILSSPTLVTDIHKLKAIHQKIEYDDSPFYRTEEENRQAIAQMMTDITIIKNESGKLSAFMHSINGQAFTSNPLHFKKYGVHMHSFPYERTPPHNSKTIPGELNNLVGESPDFFSSFSRLSVFFGNCLYYLKECMG